MTDIEENPYLSVISKRIRNVKKKLIHVEELEIKENNGIELDEGQVRKLAEKDSLKKLIDEYENVKELFSEVADDEFKRRSVFYLISG
jgi:broad-specificity NMP kinase